MRTLRLVTVGLVAAAVLGCQDPLNVDNSNNPDRNRALARPSDVEALIGGSYRVVHDGTLGGFCAINIQSMSMGLENQSNLSNNQMGPRAAIPRSPVDNSRGNAGDAGNQRDWYRLNRAARQAAVGLAAVNAPTFTFFPASAQQVARAKAMAHFIIGTALGNIALIYDQGSAISPTDNGSDPTPLPFVAFDSLMTYALAELDSSMHYDSLVKVGASDLWNGVSALAWFGSPSLTMSQDSMVAFARGYKARFRAGVARDPAARAAVNWNLVVADANAFVARWPNGVSLPMLPSAGWDIGYLSTIFQSNQGNWTMEWQFIMGMADTTTAAPYAAWLNTANASKQPFLVVTNDKRFPTGATRALQQTNGGQGSVAAPMAAGVYIRNRSAPDWVGDPYGNSFYDHDRFANFVLANRIGVYPIMTATEIRMLAAEGDIRLGAFAAASALIDVSRASVAVGLPSLVAMGITTAVQLIGPDAIHCTPHAPLLTASAVGTVSCGTIMEAMKWEKRLETQFTAPYAWYIDARGWGDLPLNTATMWPTPIEEIDARQLFANPPAYVSSYGGGGPSSALTSTYGLGSP